MIKPFAIAPDNVPFDPGLVEPDHFFLDPEDAIEAADKLDEANPVDNGAWAVFSLRPNGQWIPAFQVHNLLPNLTLRLR